MQLVTSVLTHFLFRKWPLKRYVYGFSTMPEGVRDQLLMTISKTFHCTAERAEQVFVELMLCVRKKHLVSLFHMFKTDSHLVSCFTCLRLIHIL